MIEKGYKESLDNLDGFRDFSIHETLHHPIIL